MRILAGDRKESLHCGFPVYDFQGIITRKEHVDFDYALEVVESNGFSYNVIGSAYGNIKEGDNVWIRLISKYKFDGVTIYKGVVYSLKAYSGELKARRRLARHTKPEKNIGPHGTVEEKGGNEDE